MKPKNTICLWFDKDAQEAARFYAMGTLSVKRAGRLAIR
jgi:predicted 3-demethylubiquinone-9 3-methyltransferase (glyoxalase superfamily)